MRESLNGVTLTRAMFVANVFVHHSVDSVRPTLGIGRCSSGLFRV